MTGLRAGALVVAAAAALVACSPDDAIRRDAERLEAEYAAYRAALAAAPDTARPDPPARTTRESFPLEALHPLDPARAPRPPRVRERLWTPIDLGYVAHRHVVLWLPADAPGCADRPAYLGVEPFAGWTALPLADACDADAAERIVFTLDLLHEITWPVLTVEVRDRPCTASVLLRHDASSGRYLAVGDGCGSGAPVPSPSDGPQQP